MRDRRRRRFSLGERKAKDAIRRYLALGYSGLRDRDVCARVAELTGWPIPTKPNRKPFMARYVREVIRGEPPLPEPQHVSAVVPPIRERVKRQVHIAREQQRRFAATVLRKDFYQSDEWRAVRYEALKLHGARCQCCGASPRDGIVLHVDHIKPRSKYPHLALVLANLQVLCEACNLGKMARDETDWRPVLDSELPEGAEEHLRSI